MLRAGTIELQCQDILLVNIWRGRAKLHMMLLALNQSISLQLGLLLSKEKFTT